MKTSIESHGAAHLKVSLDIDGHNPSEKNARLIEHLLHEIHSIVLQDIAVQKFDHERERSEFLALFPQGCSAVRVENKYSNRSPNRWYYVYTNVGAIMIGWRARVILIDWTNSVIEQNAKELFPEFDTTKIDKSIHVWSLQDAQQVITKLYKSGCQYEYLG